MTSFTEFVVEVHDLLDAAGIEHAFGGAVALAYYADPRATSDVDVNVFVGLGAFDHVIATFRAAGFEPEELAGGWMPGSGRRVRREGSFPVDLFPNVDDDRYAVVAARTSVRPFGAAGREVPVLAVEDIVLFKLGFGRPKDWVDIEAVARNGGTVDLDYIEEQLIGLRGPTMFPRVARLRRLFREHGSR